MTAQVKNLYYILQVELAFSGLGTYTLSNLCNPLEGHENPIDGEFANKVSSDFLQNSAAGEIS